MKVSHSIMTDTCLYVGNIDKKIDGETLTEHFKKYGEL